MAIQRNCKPIKKLLIYKALSNEALRRLIYWNVKAFTVLMKQRDIEKKELLKSYNKTLFQMLAKINLLIQKKLLQ